MWCNHCHLVKMFQGEGDQPSMSVSVISSPKGGIISASPCSSLDRHPQVDRITEMSEDITCFLTKYLVDQNRKNSSGT